MQIFFLACVRHAEFTVTKCIQTLQVQELFCFKALLCFICNSEERNTIRSKLRYNSKLHFCSCQHSQFIFFCTVRAKQLVLSFDDEINVDRLHVQVNENNKHTRTQGIILILTRETFLRNLMRTPHAALPELDYKKSNYNK